LTCQNSGDVQGKFSTYAHDDKVRPLFPKEKVIAINLNTNAKGHFCISEFGGMNKRKKARKERYILRAPL